MSWLDDLLGKDIARAAVKVLPRRGILNFSSNFVVTDNPATGSTDVSVDGTTVGTSLGLVIAVSQGNVLP